MLLLLAAAATQAAAPSPPSAPNHHQHQVVIVRKVGPDGKVTEQRLEGADAARMAETARDCDPARTFSNEVDRTVGGKRQVSRIRICAKRGETPAQWQQALSHAIARVKADPNLPADVRARVVAELQAALDKARRP